MKPFYKSKKFWAMVVGALVVVLGQYVGLTADQQQQLALVLIAYIGAVMGADWGKEAKAIESAAAERIVRPEAKEWSEPDASK
jgi:hydrogenase/urease accessory protein HupE